jgi:hypothetical protein
MSYFMVKGCFTLFTSKEEADKKALEIANQKLSNSLLVQYNIDSNVELKHINSKQELLDLVEEFDYVVSTYVEELFHKEELIP